jgi:hypothetical protein
LRRIVHFRIISKTLALAEIIGGRLVLHSRRGYWTIHRRGSYAATTMSSRKLTRAEKAARRRRKRETMIIFINGKQKRVPRPRTIDGMSVEDFIRKNADPIFLHQNEMWEYMEPDHLFVDDEPIGWMGDEQRLFECPGPDYMSGCSSDLDFAIGQ